MQRGEGDPGGGQEKALTKVSKVSWTSQLSYEIFRSSLERKSDKTNFISPKKTTSQKPASFRVKGRSRL